MSTDPRDPGFASPDDPGAPDPSRDPLDPAMPDPGRPDVPGDDPLITDPDKDGWDQRPDGPASDALSLTDALNPPRA
ncbi:hypothetical protein [Pseudomonas sp.]|uniref:hypothetical protein n=1 Tax=Pseudomonas sp. TaxID=306 RepID=UPI0028A6D362|nr:hypothetical protein [Pseudomonas sp.]